MRKTFAYTVMTLAVVSSVAGLGLFVAIPPGSARVMRVEWPEAGALCWDALLSLAFFLQHSGMVRPRFRDGIAGVIPPRYHRALYAIASGIALAAVALLWQPSERRLLTIDGPWRWLLQAASFLALGVFVWGTVAMRRFDGFGLRPIKAYVEGRKEQPPPFVVQGPYRWVRHPWYLCVIVLIWSWPVLTTDRLLFNVLWTAWICVGARLEEVDLVNDFGKAYEDYQRKVPMLIPWRGRAGV